VTRRVLVVLFGSILVAMVVITTIAISDRGIAQASRELWPNWWFRATLADAYFGFLTVYAWVFWRERSWFRRLGWFVGFMALGNIAIAIYVLLRAACLVPGQGVEHVLLPDRGR